MRTSPAGPPVKRPTGGARSRPRAGGFTLVMLLGAIAVLAIGAQAASRLTSTVVAVEREQELLFRGLAYQRAIELYYESAAAAGLEEPRYPSALNDLLSDSRFVHRRHLRALYPPPFGGEEWVLIRAADGGIMGVASPAAGKPRRQANFPLGLEAFAQAQSYRQWEFVYLPPAKADE